MLKPIGCSSSPRSGFGLECQKTRNVGCCEAGALAAVSEASSNQAAVDPPVECGINTDVIAPPSEAEGGLFSETNDNSVAILLTCGTAQPLYGAPPELDTDCRHDSSTLTKTATACG
jgi:hypothetical protein